MKNNLVTGTLAILVLVFAWLAFSPNTQEASVRKPHFASTLSASGNITCTYQQLLHTSYESGEITHELPKPETNPIIMTFVDVQAETSKIQFIDATQTISEVPAVKLADNAEKIIFLEGNGDPYITIHTIYKNLGVSTYTKQISLVGTPIGSVAMGTCVDY